ncbi:MAG: transcriptional regulator [Betaproteobacteria bacterium RIFCSPLOWO2_12_FULL_62_13b]|nr:MAG: transcriptional regulator [Betaproteobacteria bacterium RIFCSPLOWO2_12_FULL_62_13b]
MLRFGIDIGGTKIEIIALDADGRQLLRRRVATAANDYAATLQRIAALVHSAERELNQTGTVGVGTPGALSLATGLIKNSNSLSLNGKPLKDDLERLLEREVRIMNDANCFALSEATDGAGAGAANVFGVILGTGVGGGLVISGRPVVGVNAIAGEWGHNPLPLAPEEDLPLPRCNCGRFGCVEAYLSGPAFAQDHERHTGQKLQPAEIVAAVEAGDAAAMSSLERYERRLARALAIVINIVDPDVIVLGGGMSNVERLYSEVPRHWLPHVFSDRVDTRLGKHRHGDSSGVRGAAWLWNDVAA